MISPQSSLQFNRLSPQIGTFPRKHKFDHLPSRIPLLNFEFVNLFSLLKGRSIGRFERAFKYRQRTFRSLSSLLKGRFNSPHTIREISPRTILYKIDPLPKRTYSRTKSPLFDLFPYFLKINQSIFPYDTEISPI